MGLETTGCVLDCHLLHRGVVEAHLNFVAVNYGEGDESPLVNIARGIRGEMAQPPQNWRGVFLKANSVVSTMPQRPRGELDQLRHFPTGSSEIQQEILAAHLIFTEWTSAKSCRVALRP